MSWNKRLSGVKKMLRRLRNILIVLIVIILLLAGAGNGYALVTARRMLPQGSGTLSLPGLDGKGEIYRDSPGIPPIYPTTGQHLFFAPRMLLAPGRWGE